MWKRHFWKNPTLIQICFFGTEIQTFPSGHNFLQLLNFWSLYDETNTWFNRKILYLDMNNTIYK